MRLGATRPAAPAVTASPAVTAAASVPAAVAAGARTPGGALVVLHRFLGCPVFQHRLARQADAPVAIDVDDHHRQLVAHLGDILDLLHPLTVKLRDMDQPVGAGEDLDEGAEVGGAHDLAGVDTPDDGFLDQGRDALDGTLCAGGVEG